MDVREKLVELLREVQYQGNAVHGYHDKYIQNGELADHLIANGVTVNDKMEISDELLEQLRNTPVTILREEPTTEVVQEWISVKDRLPEYEEPVMGWDAEMRDMGIVNFIYGKFFDILDMSETNVTHWQYLPQPPKGE